MKGLQLSQVLPHQLPYCCLLLLYNSHISDYTNKAASKALKLKIKFILYQYYSNV